MTTSIIPVLKEGLDKFYNNDREEIHVSDLVNCLRKVVFRKLDPDRKITDRELNNFSSGRGIHGALEALVAQYPDRFDREKEVWLGDVVAHIDIWDKLVDIPVEAKTYRVFPNNIPTHKPPSSQFQQLRFYMAMTGSRKGILLGQYINDFEKFPFKEWFVELTDTDLAQERLTIASLASTLKTALKHKNPEIAPHIFYDSEKRNYLCKNCPYLDPCEQLRLKELSKRLISEAAQKSA